MSAGVCIKYSNPIHKKQGKFVIKLTILSRVGPSFSLFCCQGTKRLYFSSFPFLWVDAKPKNDIPRQNCVTVKYFVSALKKLIAALIKKQTDAAK